MLLFAHSEDVSFISLRDVMQASFEPESSPTFSSSIQDKLPTRLIMDDLVRPLKLRPKREDAEFFDDIFPETYIGRLLKGILVEFLLKQEHRLGWPRMLAHQGGDLLQHPNESVSAHSWGVAILIMTLAREPNFQEELPNFDRLRALEMALTHDIPELITGDITPVDGVSVEEKHKAEKKAMDIILGCFPAVVGNSLEQVYTDYEDRQCNESRFVKDCDKLDFIIYAFLLERQGFTGLSELYSNTTSTGFSTKIAYDLARTLVTTRNKLFEACQD